MRITNNKRNACCLLLSGLTQDEGSLQIKPYRTDITAVLFYNNKYISRQDEWNSCTSLLKHTQENAEHINRVGIDRISRRGSIKRRIFRHCVDRRNAQKYSKVQFLRWELNDFDRRFLLVIGVFLLVKPEPFQPIPSRLTRPSSSLRLSNLQTIYIDDIAEQDPVKLAVNFWSCFAPPRVGASKFLLFLPRYREDICNTERNDEGK